MPCKGQELSLEANIEAILRQAYDNYYVFIVTDSIDDAACEVARSAFSRHPTVPSYLYTSEASIAASGKVAALLTALEKDRARAEVYALIDSDALVPSGWLENLVNPLNEESVGATSGFRWYFPLHGGFWSYVEAAWNASGTNLLFHPRYNFPWGGAMAIRTETLRRAEIEKAWSSAISDDLVLNSELRKRGYTISFAPQCTVATFNDAKLGPFLRWATRQTALTRAFNRGLWNYAMMAYAFFDFVFLLGLASAMLGVTIAPLWLIPSALLFTPSGLGVLRSWQRNSTFSRAMPDFKEQFRKTGLKQAIASLIVPWIMTYCIIQSARTHEIEWRSRTYKLP